VKLFSTEPKQRTSADILQELQTAITSAIEELAGRRDITFEAIQTNALEIMPAIAMLLVQSVGTKRARLDAAVQGTQADSLLCGAGQNKPAARMTEVLNLSPAQKLANTVATARKSS
jgi:hypothetical protein